MNAIPVAMFLKDPSSWVAQPGCECQSSGVGVVHEVSKTPVVYAAGAGIPGLTSQETAILAAVLSGLATFILLLIPILCCLCPLACCTCCGFGKKKSAAAANMQRNGYTSGLMKSDNDSYWSNGIWGKGGKAEHLYDVDMKLPRPWVDSTSGSHLDSSAHDQKDGGWEGVDISRDELDAAVRHNNGVALRHGNGLNTTMTSQSGIVTYAGEHGGIGNAGAENVVYSTVDRNRGGGDEVITEYTTTRRVDMHIGGLSQDEAEGYYTKTFGHQASTTNMPL